MFDLAREFERNPVLDIARLPRETPATRPLKVLFIADVPLGQFVPDLSVVVDYTSSIVGYSKNDITVANSRSELGQKCPDLRGFDAVLIHYSIYTNLEAYFPQDWWDAVANFGGAKVLILQDEFRWGDVVNRCIEALGVGLIFSSLSTENLPRLYHRRGIAAVRKVGVLPGYVSSRFLDRPTPAVKDRSMDVVYRGRRNDFWLGAFPQEKIGIARDFLRHAANSGLALDISVDEGRRLQGDSWIDFLSASKATLGLEGGATIFDMDGSAERKTRAYLADHPDADFDAVSRDVLAPYEGNIVHKTITPRCFEAISLRTALVMYPGEYRGILERDRHYIALERDFSNFETVVGRLKDDAYLQDMVDRAYEEVVAVDEHRFETFVHRLDRLLDHAVEFPLPPRRCGFWRRMVPTGLAKRWIGRG